MYQPHIQQTINNSFQRAIQKTLFEIMFGFKMNKKEDGHIQELI